MANSMETDSSPGQRLTTASQKLFECFADDRIDESLHFEKEIHSLLGLLDNINE